MKNYLIQFLVFSFLMLSCRSDEYELVPGDAMPIDDPVVLVETHLSGLIQDENGALLSDGLKIISLEIIRLL